MTSRDGQSNQDQEGRSNDASVADQERDPVPPTQERHASGPPRESLAGQSRQASAKARLAYCFDHLLDGHFARVVEDVRLGPRKTHHHLLHAGEPVQGSLDPVGSSRGSDHPYDSKRERHHLLSAGLMTAPHRNERDERHIEHPACQH